MTRLSSLWRGWVALWDHHEHPRSLALVRIFLALCLIWDFGQMAIHDLVVPLWAPEAAGGWARVLDRGEHVPFLWTVLPAEPWVAWAIWSVLMACAVGLLTGVGLPWIAIVYVLVSAQTAHTLDAADRGIDTMIRNVMCILAFSGAAKTWSLPVWWRTGRWSDPGAVVPSWPRHLLILQLVIMYFGAGVAKMGSTWLPMSGFTALWFIIHDPAVARFSDTTGWMSILMPFTRLGTGVTIVWEYAAPLLILVFWGRHTASRGGRWRAFVLRWRPEYWYAAIGVVFHVGIAILLNLGIFPWAMLAFYPAWVHPEDWWWVRRAEPSASAVPG